MPNQTLRFLAFIAVLPILLAACGGSVPAPAGSPAGSLSAGSRTTGNGGVVLTSADLSWRALPQAPTIRGKQDDVFFISPQRGWSVNGEGNIFRTGDGGESWERVLHQPGTFFRAIVFTDSLTGFAGNIGTDYFPGVTDTVPLYRTRDGGTTWSPVAEIRGPYPKGVCNFKIAPDGRTIWASGRVGGPSFLLVSRDGGETWVSQDLTDRIAMLIDVHFVSGERGYLTGGSSTTIHQSHSVILATSDGGQSWTETFRSSNSMELGWKFDFPSTSTGYVSVLAYDSTSTFLKTEDGGRSWREHPLVAGPYQARGVGFINDDIGWMAGERPGLPAYRTSDGGRTWEADSTLGPLINRFRFVPDGRGGTAAGYAIGMTIHKLDVPPQ